MNELIPGKEEEIEAAAAIEREELTSAKRTLGYWSLFSHRYLRRTALASVPWFLMDIATYGVGLFTPLILATMAIGAAHKSTLAAEYLAIEQAAFLDLFLVLGFVINILLVDKWGRIKLQVLGFAGMALGLIILATAELAPQTSYMKIPLVLAGFTLQLVDEHGTERYHFHSARRAFPHGGKGVRPWVLSGKRQGRRRFGSIFSANLTGLVGNVRNNSDHGVSIAARAHCHFGLQS